MGAIISGAVAAARAFGVPFWLPIVILAAAAFCVVLWDKRHEAKRWLRAEAATRRRQRRFNRWLRTGRPLNPPGRTRRP
jgi:hypothetical protein